MTPFDWLTPKTPGLVQKNLVPMLNLTRFIANCVWKICRFSLKRQQGLVWHKVHFH